MGSDAGPGPGSYPVLAADGGDEDEGETLYAAVLVDSARVLTMYFIWKFWTRLRSTNMRMVASVVSVSDNSKSLKLKSRSRSD